MFGQMYAINWPFFMYPPAKMGKIKMAESHLIFSSKRIII
jgi:hypothetical protein